VRSRADFKPANPNILVRDLEKDFDGAHAFVERYPIAWGYVWANQSGYSKGGKPAIIDFEGGSNGIHGMDWTDRLTRKGKRWEVERRHLHPREWAWLGPPALARPGQLAPW
jgi:hypothetical protein